MQIVKIILSLALIAAVSSCKLIRKDDDRKPVARVFEHYLYEDDIRGLTNGMSAEDSTVFIQNFIFNWGKEQLLIYRAEYNLRDEQKDFDDLVIQYRNDLLKFAYIDKYVNEHLDTTISEAEINSYYEDHSQDFELKENIVKAEYYIVEKSAPDLEKTAGWWRSNSEKNKEKFLEYMSIFAKEKSVGDTNWVRYSELAFRIPLQTYNQEALLVKNTKLVLEDSLKVFFVAINAYKIKDAVSPLAYVRQTVKSIILNKRKLDLISKMEESLVNDAYDKKDFEIY